MLNLRYVLITFCNVSSGSVADSINKVFRHVETLFVQGNIFVLNQNKPPCLVIKKEVNYC